MALDNEALELQIQELRGLVASNRNEAAPSTGFKLKIGGSEYEVQNQNEAQRLVDQYEQQRQGEVESLRLRYESQQPVVEQQAPVREQHRTGDTFDKEQFAKEFLNDPRQGIFYSIQNDPRFVQFFSGVTSELTRLKQEAAARDFVDQNSDYVRTPENFKALEAIIGQNGLQWDANGMRAAFAIGKQYGTISGGDQQAPQREDGDNAYQVDSRQYSSEEPPAPPRVNRRSNSVDSQQEALLAEFERLSPEQMKTQIEKWSGQGLS